MEKWYEKKLKLRDLLRDRQYNGYDSMVGFPLDNSAFIILLDSPASSSPPVLRRRLFILFMLIRWSMRSRSRSRSAASFPAAELLCRVCCVYPDRIRMSSPPPPPTSGEAHEPSRVVLLFIL